jgi:hypothetical protein
MGNGVPDFDRLRAALLHLSGGGMPVTIDTNVFSARQSLSVAFDFAHKVSRAFDDAMRLSLMAGYSHAQLQPLQAMSDTVNGHIGVILCCFRYFMLPDDAREVFWRAQWSDSDTDTDSDTDSDSDYD